MFDFPTAPVIDDEHTEGGVTYVFRGGGVWDLKGGGELDDKVNKAGDTMTGELSMSGVPVRYMDRSYPTPNASELVLTCDNKGYPNWNKASIRYSSDGYTKGWLEIFDTDAKNVAFKHSGIEVARPIKIGDGAGIHWGSTGAQTDKYNFSEGICLYGYGTTSQFGFTITSGTLNYCVQNEGNKHEFWVGSKNALTIEDMEVRPINKVIGRTTTDGLNGYFIGDQWHGLCFNGSNTTQLVEYHGNFEFVKRNTGTTGGTVLMRFQDSGGLYIKGNRHINIENDGYGVFFNSGGLVYKKVGTGMTLRKHVGNTQWGIENHDGSGRVNIATSGLDLLVEDQIRDAVAPLLASIAELKAELAALKKAKR